MKQEHPDTFGVPGADKGSASAPSSGRREDPIVSVSPEVDRMLGARVEEDLAVAVRDAQDLTAPNDLLGAPSARESMRIGEILMTRRRLDSDGVERVLALQRERHIRFGEAAVSLGLAQPRDIVNSLAWQYRYPVRSPSAPQIEDELIMARDPFGAHGEKMRELRSELILRGFARTEEGHARPLAVVSPGRGEGRSYFCANMAVALSQIGGRTLLIDADLRQPRQHRILGVEPGQVTLENVLARRSRLALSGAVPGFPGLYLLPAGTEPPNPQELVQGEGFRRLLAWVTGRFDHIIVDTPASSLAADARVIAAQCGSALLIGRRDTTQTRAARSLVESLQGTGTHLAGVVLNDH